MSGWCCWCVVGVIYWMVLLFMVVGEGLILFMVLLILMVLSFCYFFFLLGCICFMFYIDVCFREYVIIVLSIDEKKLWN